MRTFEEIVKEIIWQKENVSLKNAVNELKIAFSKFTIEVADQLLNENIEASNLFYDASREVREAMESKNIDELQRLKGKYFAIKFNNNLEEINEMLIKEGFIPDNEWNNYKGIHDNTTHVIVYSNLMFEFHNHDGFSKIIIEL